MSRHRLGRIKSLIKIKTRSGRRLGITATGVEVQAQMDTLLPLIRIGRYQDAAYTAENAAASLIMLADDIEHRCIGAGA